MPTAVVQLQTERLPSRIEVAAPYTRGLVILRRHNEPVARFDLPVINGEVDRTAFTSALFEAVEANGPRWLARDYLGPDPKRPMPDATVAICTRERPGDLRRALAAVQALSPAPLEVLVVDNAPTSAATRQVVAEFEARYVCEPREGLDYARNRALSEARANLIAFTDDDAVPEPAWLEALLQPFADARVWCVTGLTLPLELETPAQEWFERYSSFSRGFARRVFDGTRHDPLAVGAIGAGANMAVRRSILTVLGGFDEALDAGTPTRSGGDHEMFGRILAAGHRIAYEPTAVSWHRHRRTWPELRDTLHGYGVGVFAIMTRRLLREHEPRALRHPFAWLYRHHLPALWHAVWRHAGSVPLDLISSEISGCLRGPVEYARAVRQTRRSVR